MAPYAKILGGYIEVSLSGMAAADSQLSKLIKVLNS